MNDNQLSHVDDAWKVRRTFLLPSLNRESDAGRVAEVLNGQPGVFDVSVDLPKKRIAVRYLMTQCDYQYLEQRLRNAGFSPKAGWWARFKSNWYQNLDLNARANAAAPPAACCNKPPARRK